MHVAGVLIDGKAVSAGVGVGVRAGVCVKIGVLVGFGVTACVGVLLGVGVKVGVSVGSTVGEEVGCSSATTSVVGELGVDEASSTAPVAVAPIITIGWSSSARLLMGIVENV